MIENIKRTKSTYGKKIMWLFIRISRCRVFILTNFGTNTQVKSKRIKLQA